MFFNFPVKLACKMTQKARAAKGRGNSAKDNAPPRKAQQQATVPRDGPVWPLPRQVSSETEAKAFKMATVPRDGPVWALPRQVSSETEAKAFNHLVDSFQRINQAIDETANALSLDVCSHLSSALSTGDMVVMGSVRDRRRVSYWGRRKERRLSRLILRKRKAVREKRIKRRGGVTLGLKWAALKMRWWWKKKIKVGVEP